MCCGFVEPTYFRTMKNSFAEVCYVDRGIAFDGKELSRNFYFNDVEREVYSREYKVVQYTRSKF